MMGMTHVFAGTMAALVVTQPSSPGGCLAALAGGALGAVVCDVDLGRKNRVMEAAQAGQTALGISLVCLMVDAWLNTGLIRSIRAAAGETMAVGVLGAMVLLLWGSNQPHRGGTHSALMVLLLGMCMKLICPPAAVPLMIGIGSHIVMDMLNCRPVQLLYPMRGGVCLCLCRADGRLDRMIRTACMMGTVLWLSFSLGRIL